MSVADAERLWHDYAEPPAVTAQFNRPSEAIVRFDGGSLSRWEREGGGEIKWTVSDGELQIVPKSGSIVTDRPFKDFAMHLEFKLPKDDDQAPPEAEEAVFIKVNPDS